MMILTVIMIDNNHNISQEKP